MFSGITAPAKSYFVLLGRFNYFSAYLTFSGALALCRAAGDAHFSQAFESVPVNAGIPGHHVPEGRTGFDREWTGTLHTLRGKGPNPGQYVVVGRLLG